MRTWLTRKKPETIPSDGKPSTTEGWLHPESAEMLLAETTRQQLIQFIRQSTALPASLFERFWLIPIHRFAELAQLFPASENHHHSHTGGLLDHSLEVACYAARLRQSYLFPPDAAPEDQAAQSERWTTVIIYAALLHDLGKLITDIEVEDVSGKRWFPWHGPLTQSYRFRYLPQRDYLHHPAAVALLLTQLLPPESLDWLAADAAALSTLLHCLNGQYQYAGLAGELVQKADRASVAFNLGGDPVKAIHRPQTSLPQQIIAALRDLLAHEFRLNNPNGGSDGWLTEKALWLVSKNAADAVRGWLLRQGIDAVPQHNVRLFDEMQAHQLLIPSEDKAIWHCRIEASGGWSSELTLLRFSPSLIWEDPQQRPATFSGSVTPIAGIRNETEAVIETNTKVEQPSTLPEQDDTPLSGEAFWQWLVRNVQAQHLEVNEPNARIHTVAGSVFLVTPGIFKLWLSTCGQNVPEEYWREVQKKFQNLNLHRKQKNGLNIWHCAVVGPRRCSRLKGYLLDDPTPLFGDDVPFNNPHLLLNEGSHSNDL
ncbi:MobH family relaxase [Citrobacter youngae]|uniref:Integrating conjugative element relaxase, PFGI-1 class n=1 Tax=Citrobacter youngae ATCC 29220 TaxID=500640 RepID=D4BFZ2_9ENTR|nr:MobH family relaxase [Citrobacter youngae]EFE07279.1 integrating conjugative element relaxase, PFGI-1 class [Citrobacter youngae ATCC 29220]